jgi:predicted permease
VIADLRARLRALLLGRRWSRELDEELRFHLEQETAARIRAGEEPAAARREARRAFGGVDRYKEEARDAIGVRAVDDLAADVRFALRALRRNPAFALTAVLVLAVAIGATSAVATVVHAVLIADLPYPHPDRLVRIYEKFATGLGTVSVVDFEAIRAQQRTLQDVGVARRGAAALSGVGEPEQIQVARVTSGFFGALGTEPATGRLIAPGDEPVGSPPVVVVSDAFAARRLGGAGAAIGRSITLDGLSHTVIGVLAPGVDELAGVEAAAWPVLQLPAPTRRGPFGLFAIGRLRDGVTLEAASQDLAGVSERIYPLWSSGFRDRTARLSPFPLRETIVGPAHDQLRLFAGAVALVFLVAVANVATLMLVRASTRRHELALRATLGASRSRLARLVATENVVLAAVAAAGGIGLAALGLGLVGAIAPRLPRAREIALGRETMLIAAALAVIAGVLVSASPVASLLGGGLASLRADAPRTGSDRRTRAVRGALVAGEFALALPLLLGAALLGTSFLRLERVNPGYDASAAFDVVLSLPPARYPGAAEVSAFWRRAVQATLEVPGVVAAGLATASPPDNRGDVNNFNLVAHPVPSGGSEPVSPWSYVTPGYFDALRIPLLEGRMFAEADTDDAPPVVIVSRSWAAHYFPREAVIGEQLVEGGCYQCPLTTIVGVVGDVKYQGLKGGGDGVYGPLAQAGARNARLFVRVRGSPGDVIAPVLARLRALDPEIPLAGVTMSDQLRQAVADPGRWTAVLSAFAVTAVALAALGIFGLLSYLVRGQRREIGVRLALGAGPRRVTGMIVARGMRYVLLGTLAGMLLTLLEGRWLRALLFGVAPGDPRVLAAVTALLLLAAFLACLLPGLRAARIAPVEAITEG